MRDPLPNSALGKRLALGEAQSLTKVHKFGAASAVGTSLVPIASSKTYQTPTSAAALEILSASTDDAAAGTGGQAVTVFGLDASFNEISEVVELNGTTAVDLVNTYTRVFRMFVSRSGTYATASASSHAGVITLRGDGGGATWALIDTESSFGLGQSQIGAYTVPAGKTGYITSYHRSVETTKAANLVLFQRLNADDVSAPYSGTMRIVHIDRGLDSAVDTNFDIPIGPFVGPCDIGVLGEATATTANISVDFVMMLDGG